MQPIALSINDAVRISGIGRTKLYALISGGSLKARKLGKRTLILTEDLDKLLNSLPVSGGE